MAEVFCLASSLRLRSAANSIIPGGGGGGVLCAARLFDLLSSAAMIRCLFILPGVCPRPAIIYIIDLAIKEAVLPRPARVNVAEMLEAAQILEVAELRAVIFYAVGAEVLAEALGVAVGMVSALDHVVLCPAKVPTRIDSAPSP